MKFRTFSLAVVALLVGLVQVALGLTPPEVSDIAKKVTVRIEGNASGTGVMVARQGNTYTVLTNAHVLQRRKNYSVQTFDGKTYLAVSRDTKRLPGVDLSLIQFSSEENYAIAEIGNSDRLNEGMTLYVGGWAATDRVNRERGYRFSEGQLSGRATNAEEGYALIYSNAVKPGMSGSPVFNEEGQLVGINGKAVTDIRTGAVDYYGIPINIYLQLARSLTPVRADSAPTGGGEINPPAASPSPTAQIGKNQPSEAGGTQSSTNPPTPQINLSARSITVPTVTYPDTSDRRPEYSLAATLAGHNRSVYSLAYSPDGKKLASGSQDKTIKIWDVSTKQEIYNLTGHQDSVYSVAYSPDGKKLASGSQDKTIKIWDVTSGKEIRTLKGHTEVVSSVAYSTDGQNIASASWDKTIKIWDVATGQEIYTLKGHTDAVDSLAYSPDGKTLASASWDKTIKLWDLTTGREIRTLTGHTQAIDALAYSPDGKTLASGSGDKTIKIWDVATGKQIRTLTGHSETVNALAFSPDGQTLASGSGDKIVKLWDVATGTEVDTLKSSSDSIYALVFSPDGRTLASGSSNMDLVGDSLDFEGGSIAIWQLSRW